MLFDSGVLHGVRLITNSIYIKLKASNTIDRLNFHNCFY